MGVSFSSAVRAVVIVLAERVRDTVLGVLAFLGFSFGAAAVGLSVEAIVTVSVRLFRFVMGVSPQGHGLA
jgi:hypothetical protein